MHARLGSGLDLPRGPAGLAASNAAAPAPAPPAPLPAQRNAALARAGSVREMPARDTPALPGEPPMASSLAAAARLCRTATQQVVAMFDGASRGEPVPLAVAQDTVDRLLCFLDDEPQLLLGVVRLKAHGDYAHMHSVAVSALMASLARELHLDAATTREAALAGLLHDIGKAFIAPRILGKPGKLNDDEFTVVRTHPQRGFEALDASDGVGAAAKDVALHHHERPDGRGYPRGLYADRLSRMARMGAVCDVYDAITSNRPYKTGWDPLPALDAMRQWARGGQFDTAVLEAFARMMGAWPVGSLVRLRSQRLAVVNAASNRRAGRTHVTAFYCAATQRVQAPEVLWADDDGGADAIVAFESNAQWRFKDLDRLWAGDAVEVARASQATARLFG